jgi:isopenicillin N synthase-like dioxygenase
LKLRQSISRTLRLRNSYEGLDFYASVDNPDPSRPLWGTNQWPEIPGFRSEYERWVDKMKQLGLIVMEA